MRGIVWKGTNNRDVKFGGHRDDRLIGRGGNDDLHGRSGDDWLLGGYGRDRLFGGNGDDVLFGHADRDRLEGNGGKDLLRGGMGNDLLDGGSGADRLHGGNGADKLIGGSGADLLRGDAENDVLRGGPGNDTLIGGAGFDIMSGGSGRDVFVFETDDVQAFVVHDLLETVATTEGGPAFANSEMANRWVAWNVAGGGRVGIDSALPQNGDKSVHLVGTDGTVGEANGDYSAGIGFFWDPAEGPSLALGDENSSLGRLQRLSYDWYRSAESLDGEGEAPALRLHIDADGDLDTADTVLLIYEPIYNGGGIAPVDAWQTVGLGRTGLQNANFWALEPGTGLDRTYDRSLAEWIDGGHSPGFSELSAASQVFGLDIGIGDGWVGSFDGAIDNPSIEFAEARTRWNFEDPRPDRITDFRSGRDVLDLSMILQDVGPENIDQYLRVTSENSGDSLVSIDLAGSGEVFQPLVLLHDATIDLARDVLAGEAIIV